MPVHERKRARKQGTVNFLLNGSARKESPRGRAGKNAGGVAGFLLCKKTEKTCKGLPPIFECLPPPVYSASATGEAKRAGVWGREKRRGATDSPPVFRRLLKSPWNLLLFHGRPPADKSSRRSRGESLRKQTFFILCKKKIVSGKHNLSFIIFFKIIFI